MLIRKMILRQNLDPLNLFPFFLLLLEILIADCHGLSKPIPRTLQTLCSQGLLLQPHPDLYVLGTVHLGCTSAQDARLVVETLQPSKVIVELPPSRLKGMDKADTQKMTTVSGMNLLQALGTFPAMASAGLSIAGMSGLLVTTGMIWSSLVKRSLTSREENALLPRLNEFVAAIAAANSSGADVVPADWEFEELVTQIATAMTSGAWTQLALTALKEAIGIEESDPINRKKDESMVDWERRRRKVDTARASRAYSERTTPELHQVLVTDRDEEFARFCVEAVEQGEDRPIVCIVGLVHADGIANAAKKRLNNRQEG